MRYYVYILFSSKLLKYYVGQTQNLTSRLEEHNKGMSHFTSKGIPWKLVHYFECDSRSKAIMLETKIKKRGIARFLLDNNIKT